MIKYLRLFVIATALISLTSEALALTNLVTTAPKTGIVPKTQTVVVPKTETVAPTQGVIPPNQIATTDTAKIVASQTGTVTPPTPPPQAPTNPPTVATVTPTRDLLGTGARVSLTPTVVLSTTDKIDIDFRTGGDNLEPKDCQSNPDLYIYIRGRDPIHIPNINNGGTWPNNSVRRVTIPLDGTIKLEDLESIKISRSTPSLNNVCGTAADNWNLDKLTVTASIKVNGRNQRTIIANVVPPSRGQPVFRFVYERRGNPDPNIGTEWSWNFTLPRATSTPTPSAIPTGARIIATIATGGDNLEGGRDNNVNITLRFNSSTRVVTINNINASASWANWTENTVSKDIPSSTTLDINDIKSVEIRHTGGGGMFADNWHVDKIYITISKDGISRVLVDKVGAPVHMFTGDTRRKTFTVGE